MCAKGGDFSAKGGEGTYGGQVLALRHWIIHMMSSHSAFICNAYLILFNLNKNKCPTAFFINYY